MRPVLLNLTVSLDGFIADPEGGIDWLLPMPQELPGDYLALMERIDTLVMGRATYETSLALEGGTQVFEGKQVYVFTRQRDLHPRAGVHLIHEDPVAFVSALRDGPGDTIWVFGGGQIATLLSEAGLIDEYLLALQPIRLGRGIPLWRESHQPTRLKPVLSRTWPDGVVELRYRRADAGASGRAPEPRSMRVRRAHHGDEDVVRRLRLQAVQDAPDAFETTLEREQARSDADWSAWLEERATFILEHDGEAKGLVAGVPHREDPTAVYLIAMWVDPTARGTGGSDALVAAVLGWAAAQGARTVCLDVGKSNEAAYRLYARQGFRATGHEWTQERTGIVEIEMQFPIEGKTL